MPKLTIDGKEIEVEAGTVLIQACEQLGIEIPRAIPAQAGILWSAMV